MYRYTDIHMKYTYVYIERERDSWIYLCISIQIYVHTCIYIYMYIYIYTCFCDKFIQYNKKYSNTNWLIQMWDMTLSYACTYVNTSAVCCSMCVAMCCNVLQYVAMTWLFHMCGHTYVNASAVYSCMWVAMCCNVMQFVVVCCSEIRLCRMCVLTSTHLRCVAVCVLQCVAICCSVMHWHDSFICVDSRQRIYKVL